MTGGGGGGSGVGTAGDASTGGSSGTQQQTGGSGGIIVADSGAARDAAIDAANDGSSISVDAGSPCGLAVDSTSHIGGSNQPQLVVSHTVRGLNRLLIVALGVRHDTGVQNAIPATVSVTLGAVALTRLKLATDSYYQEGELWALVAPALGVNQVTVKFASAPQQAVMGVMSFTGAAQSSTFGMAAAIAGGGASATVSVPTTGYAAVVDLLSHGGVQLWNAAAGQLELWRDGTNAVHGYSSFSRVSAATTTRSWAGMAAANYVLIGQPIAEVRCM
jgi:hypothetical protein